jgi:hypothetical protein
MAAECHLNLQAAHGRKKDERRVSLTRLPFFSLCSLWQNLQRLRHQLCNILARKFFVHAQRLRAVVEHRKAGTNIACLRAVARLMARATDEEGLHTCQFDLFVSDYARRLRKNGK